MLQLLNFANLFLLQILFLIIFIRLLYKSLYLYFVNTYKYFASQELNCYLKYLMSSFADKSQQSLTSAEMLLKNNFYPSSVNRSYYAFHQFVLHILFNKLKNDKAEFETDVLHQGGTNKLAWNKVSIEFIKRNRDDYRWMQSKVQELKLARVNADYTETVIHQEDAHNVYGITNSMINSLKRTF